MYIEDERGPKNLGTKLLNLYVYGSLHIAFSASFYTLFFFQFAETIDWNFISFVFFSTWSTYSSHKVIGIIKVKKFANKGRFKIIKQYKNHIYLYLIIALLGAFICFLRLNNGAKVIALICGMISVLYVSPIFKGKKRLRDYGLGKIFLISVVWSVVCTYIPLSESTNKIDGLIISFSSFLFIFGITIPFDIRDLEIEDSLDVSTIPSLLGAKKSIVLSILILLSSGLIPNLTHNYEMANIMLLSSLIGILFVYLFGRKENDLYYSFILDSLMIVPIILYWLNQLLLK